MIASVTDVSSGYGYGTEKGKLFNTYLKLATLFELIYNF